MRPKNVKTLLYVWAAVTALLLSVGCSKSGGGGGGPSLPPPAPAPAPKQVSGEVKGKQQPGDKQKDIGKKPGRRGGELDKDSSKSAQDEEVERLEDDVPGEQTPPPVDQGSAGGEGEIVMDPRGMEPKQIFGASEKLGNAPVGQASGEDAGETLFYTGAGQDLLVQQLKALIETEGDEDSRLRDQQLASSIGLSTFTVDMNTRRAQATITLAGANGSTKQHEFKGLLDNQMRLRGGDLKKGLAFESVCMDERGGCNTVHMRIRTKSREGVRTAHVVARHSAAHIYSEGTNPEQSNNPEYRQLMGILVNTAIQPNRADTVRAISFWSSEVINGRSDFAISMALGTDPYNQRAQQRFTMSGPLVKPSSASDMNLVIARPSGLTSIDGRKVVSRGRLMDSIRELRLVKNDGRGNLQFDIVVRKGSQRADEDTIRLTVARIHEPVKSPIVR